VVNKKAIIRRLQDIELLVFFGCRIKYKLVLRRKGGSRTYVASAVDNQLPANCRVHLPADEAENDAAEE
jgi:hypothetical protein